MNRPLDVWRSAGFGLLMTGALLSGCGGSSGGGSKDPLAVSGTAAKGIVLGAQVQAFDAGGVLVSETLTSLTDGSYALEVPARFSGALKLVMSNPAGATAAVVCDAQLCGQDGTGTDIVFGDRYPLDFELRSVVYVDKGATSVSAAITPLTTLVADLAATIGALDQASIANANATVREVLKLDADPATIAPVDLTTASDASQQALEFALLNAAFAELAAGGVLDVLLANITAGLDAGSLPVEFFNDLQAAAEGAATVTAADNAAIATAVNQASAVINQELDEVIAGCGDECQVPVPVDPDLQDDLARAKALVQAVRTVTVDAISLVEGEELNEASVYNRAQAASELVSEDAAFAATATGYLADTLVWQLHRVLMDGLELEADLPLAAGMAFDEFYDETEECQWSWQWWGYESQQACVDDQQVRRAEFVARFEEGSVIQREGRIWSVNNVVVDNATISLILDLPEDVAGLAAEESIGFTNVSAAYGTALLEVDEFLINTQLADAIADFETVDEATVEPQHVSIVLNGARVSMLEDPRYIEANMELRAVRSPQHASLNEQSDIFFMLPKQISLDGKLFDSVEETDQGLDVAFVLTFDAENFGFIEEGLQRTDLATYIYDGDTNTVSITTLPSAGGSLTYDVSISGGEGNFVYLEFECSEAGGAVCSSTDWQDAIWTGRSIEYRTPYGDEQELGGECFGEGDDTFCYVPWSNALNDLRIGLRTRELWFLDRAEIAAEEGVFRLGDEWNDNGLGLNADSGFVVATLHDPHVDLDEDGRFLKGMLTVSVEGRLSSNLPEMSIVLNASRDGYRTAAADLTLTWGDSLVRIDIDQDDVTDVTEVLESFTISDGAGTTMRILNVVDLPQGENGDIGQITKDGTVYGTIRQENDVVLVHWIDNRIETLF